MKYEVNGMEFIETDPKLRENAERVLQTYVKKLKEDGAYDE